MAVVRDELSIAEKIAGISKTYDICVFQIFVLGLRPEVRFPKHLRLYAHAEYYTPITNENMIKHQIKLAHSHNFKGIICHLLKRPPAENAKYISKITKYIEPGFLLLAEIPALKSGPNSYETPEKIKVLISELKAEGVDNTKCKICVDTSHLHSGGIKLSSVKDARAWLEAIDPAWIGNIALNDSKSELGGADVHEHVGLGKIWPIYQNKETELKLHENHPEEISGYVEFIKYAKKYDIDVILERSGNLFTVDQYELCSLNILYNSIN